MIIWLKNQSKVRYRPFQLRSFPSNAALGDWLKLLNAQVDLLRDLTKLPNAFRLRGFFRPTELLGLYPPEDMALETLALAQTPAPSRSGLVITGVLIDLAELKNETVPRSAASDRSGGGWYGSKNTLLGARKERETCAFL